MAHFNFETNLSSSTITQDFQKKLYQTVAAGFKNGNEVSQSLFYAPLIDYIIVINRVL